MNLPLSFNIHGYGYSPLRLCSCTYTFIDFLPRKDGKTTRLNLFAEAIELTPISLNEFTNFMYLIIKLTIAQIGGSQNTYIFMFMVMFV